jgi:hypothetical protein
MHTVPGTVAKKHGGPVLARLLRAFHNSVEQRRARTSRKWAELLRLLRGGKGNGEAG